MTVKVKDNIYAVGSLDWDRRLFDELIPLPEGTTYNSYVIKGSQKTALIDTVDPTKEAELLQKLEKLGVDRVDYVVSHHAEQDHSGAIPRILCAYPDAKVVTNEKCKDFLKDLLHVDDDKFITVKDGEELSLGDKTLRFILTPWVHWPETMVTYLKEDRILFSCDFFGSHMARSDVFVTDEPATYRSAKRYYAEIMMPFRAQIRSNLEKLKPLQIDMIAPSHGPIYDKPEFIMNAYREWVSDAVKNEVVIAHVSMHGSTQEMVRHLTETLAQRGITVKPYNIPKSDIGELAMDLVDAATIIVATPTVLAGAHPAALYATHLANALRPKARYLAIIGSYGWGGKTIEQLSAIASNLKVEVVGTVMAKGRPKEPDFAALDKLADEIAKRHESL